MYTDERAEGDRKYSGEVFGEDAARLLTEDLVDDEPIRLPVFGARDGDEAMLAIIESNAEAAYINAMSGNKRTGYSNVYAEFYLRGYDVVNSGTQILKYDVISKISEQLSPAGIQIGFYPLSDADAGYTGMASRYKRYLEDGGLMTKTSVDSNTYGVNIVGGVMSYDTKLGFPGKSLNVMTTFEEAADIIGELKEISDMTPEVCLTGFGKSGIMPGKVAGGFGFSGKFGGKKKYQKLNELCGDNNISLYTDFDLIRFTSSGNGFTALFDTAKSATLQAVKKSDPEIPLRSFGEDSKYRLLKREKLDSAVQKLIKSASRLSVSGISLSSLGNTAYSDYSESKYYVKGNAASDVADYINQIMQANHATAAFSANSYAAALSDAVFDAPTDNGGYTVFDFEIPFYEMVFGSDKRLYSSALNVAADYGRQIMLSAIGGARLSFTLVNSFDTSCLDIQSQRLYSSVFEDNRDLIAQTLEKYGPFYTAVNGAAVKDYIILSDNISKTVFDNGVVLYANHGAQKCESPYGSLEAYGIAWKESEMG